MKKSKFQKLFLLQGFTLIEILMVLALVGILSTASITMIGAISDDASYDRTFGRMQLIRTALIGDLDTTKQGLREYYGYLGDVGTLPTVAHQGLEALINQPASVGAFAVDSVTSKIGMGWRGPYLKATVGVNWLNDAWGRAFIYEPTASPPYIESLGADGVAGGSGPNEDIRFNLGPEFTTATIHGVINENGKPLPEEAVVQLYTPNGNGVLETRSVTLDAGDNGYFSFSNVPFGQRALKVSFPDLTDPVDEIGPVMLSVDNSNYTIAHNFLDRTPGALPHTCDDPDALGSYDIVNDTGRLVKGGDSDSDGDRDDNNDFAVPFFGSNTKSDDERKGVDLSRFYFEMVVRKSISINDIYVQFSDTDVRFEGLSIGNESRYCRYHEAARSGGAFATDYFTCYDYDTAFYGSSGEIEDTCDGVRLLFNALSDGYSGSGNYCTTNGAPTMSISFDRGVNTNPRDFPQINLNAAWVIKASDPDPATPPDGVGFTPNYGKRVSAYIHVRGADESDVDAVTSIKLRLGCKMTEISIN